MIKPYNLLFLFLFSFFWLGSKALPDFWYVFAISSLSFFVIYIFITYKKDYAFGVLFVFYFFSYVWAGSSNLYIEFGGYVSEQGRFGFPVGSTSSWFLFCSIFSFFSIFSFNFFSSYVFKGERNVFSFQNYKFSFWLIFFSFVPFFYVGLMWVYGSPLIEGVERFNFWNEVPHFFARFMLFYQFFFIILGVVFYNSKSSKSKFFCIFLVLLNLIVLVFAAEKFTSLLNIVFYFSIGFLLPDFYNNKKKLPIKKLILYAVLVFVVLLVVVVINYVLVSNRTPYAAFERILDRTLGLEGHVWYGVYRDYVLGKMPLSSDVFWKTHIEEHPTGIVALMWEIAPSNLVEAMRQLKIGFTKGSPAVALSVYGFFGAMVVSIVGGFFVGVSLSIINVSIKQNRLFLLMFVMVFYRTLIDIFITGDYYFLWSNSLVFSLFLVLISLFFIFLLRGAGFVIPSNRSRFLRSHSC